MRILKKCCTILKKEILKNGHGKMDIEEFKKLPIKLTFSSLNGRDSFDNSQNHLSADLGRMFNYLLKLLHYLSKLANLRDLNSDEVSYFIDR